MAPRDETSGRTGAPVKAFRKARRASPSGISTCIVFHTSKPVGAGRGGRHQFVQEPRHDHDGRARAVLARERHEVTIAHRIAAAQRLIRPFQPQIRHLAPQPQQRGREIHLDASVGPVREQRLEIRRRRRSRQFFEHRRARGEIHRLAIVGIDEMKIPQLVALIEVDDARRRHFEDELRQRIDRAEPRDVALERHERREERRRGVARAACW